MSGPIRSANHARQAALLALLVSAFLLRALVPAGWMPVHDAQGVHLTVCDGMGPADAMARMGLSHGRDDEHRHPAGAGHPCAFAALGLAFDAPFVQPVAPVARTGFQLFLSATGQEQLVQPGLAAPPPPQTGPPLVLFA